VTRYAFTLKSNADRERVVRAIAAAPSGTRVELKAAKRTIPQNDRMWSILTDIAQQLPWHGQRLRPDDWKIVFMGALKRELRLVPNLDETGFVDLGRSSSDLSKGEMSDLMELMTAFAIERGVTLHDPAAVAA
jgi:hypothetical protein